MIQAFMLTLTILFLGGCSTPQRLDTGRVILRREKTSGFVSQYLQMRQVSLGSDERGLLIARTAENHRVLDDLSSILHGRKDVLEQNLAYVDVTDNVHSTVEVDSLGAKYTRYAPYRRREMVLRAEKGKVTAEVVEDPSAFRVEDNPSHPHSVKNPEAADFGRVYYPNISAELEKRLIAEAGQSYEAILEALEAWEKN